MGVGRGWKITLNVKNRAIFWIFVGILLVQGTLAEPNNATSAEETSDSQDSDEVEVVSLVKKDKRQAQRGYTDVPLDKGPFDELIASSPAPIAFENDLPTFVDSLSDIADATPADYNSNTKFSGFKPFSSSSRGESGTNSNAGTLSQLRTDSLLTSASSTPQPLLISASPSTFPSVIVAKNALGQLTNISRPVSFFNQNQISVALNNGVPFGPVSETGSGVGGPGITPTGRLTDSLALPDHNAAAAINIERRQADVPLGAINEPPPFNGKAIPGDAGIDYPIYGEVPRTQFSCKDHKWPGYYADTQARCQVFWICQKHRMDGFLCPNGTLFNQQVFVCDWWFNVDCSAAPEYYSRNQFVYAGPGIGIDGQPVRGLSLPIAATNRVASVLPPLPPPIRNNNFLIGGTSAGSQVQSSNQVARVAPATTRPADFQSRADSLNNYLKSIQGGTGSGQSYQSQLVNRLQSNPNRLHDTGSSIKGTVIPPILASLLKDKDRRVPAASSQISQAQISHLAGTSRPSVANYQPQHVETVSIVTTPPHPSTRTTPRPPPPPIPKIPVSAKPIKGPSPTPFANVIKLGTTVTVTSPRPDYSHSTKSSLFKGIISSTVKPSKASGFRLTSNSLAASNQRPKTVSIHHPGPTSAPQNYRSRPGLTEDPTNTVRPADYTPSRAPDPTPPTAFSSPGYLPTNRPHQYVESSSFGRGDRHGSASSSKSTVSHGMRSNQFSNVNGQRENIYATSRKDTFVEFPYSPSQQKNKQRLAEQAANKDVSSSKRIATAIPHFFGQRSNVFSGSAGTDSFSYISNNNKGIVIDHTINHSQRQGPFTKPNHQAQEQHHRDNNHFPQDQQPQHSGPSRQLVQYTTTRAPPTPTARQQFVQIENDGPSPSRLTPSLAPPPQQIHQSTRKPEQRFIVPLAPSPTPHPNHFASSTPAPPHQQHHQQHQQQQQHHQQQQQQQQQQFHQVLPQKHPHPTFPPQLHSTFPPQLHPTFPPQSHPTFPPQHHPTFAPQSHSTFSPQQHPTFPPQHHPTFAPQSHPTFPPVSHPTFPPQSHPSFPPHSHSTFPPNRNDGVTQRDGFAPLNSGSFVSIQTTAPPFSQQILKHNSLQPYQEPLRGNGGIVTYTTGAPPPPQQVIFTGPPTTTNHNVGPIFTSTAAPRNFNHGHHQQNVLSSTPQPKFVSSTAPGFIERVTPPSVPASPTPYSTPNNFIAAPTQSSFRSTSPGHRQNPYLPHNHGRQKSKQQHRPPPPQQQQQPLSVGSGATFPAGGITTTIKYPEGTGKLRLDFSGGNAHSNRKSIVDFTYSATPSSTTPAPPSPHPNYIHHSSTTPYPTSADRFTQAVSSTTVRPYQSPPSSSGSRLAGAVKNKSNLSSSAIYVDTAATAESVSTPVSVPSPSATTPSSISTLPPVSTSNYGLRLSATAKKRMTGAWQSYFSSNSKSEA